MNSFISTHLAIQNDRFRLLSLGQFTLVAATWTLWTPQNVFPQIPLISIAGSLAGPVEFGLLALVLISVAVMTFMARPVWQRSASLLMGLGTLGLVAIDQHRLQPWAWQFIILSVVLATARASTAVAVWKWLVVGIYAWSAWSKMDHSFCIEHGPFLIDGFCKSIGLTNGTQAWPAGLRYAAAAAIPLIEFSLAIGLCWKPTQRSAVVAAAMMHLGLLSALGPFGHRHQPAVLIWNVFFLIQNWLLFASQPAASLPQDGVTSDRWANIGDHFARTVVAAAMIWPLFEPLGRCDHWPAWAVYAAQPERVRILLNETDVAKLPDHLQQYLGTPDFDGWSALRIDRWSLDAVHAPIYPQDRFQVGVALWLAQECKLNQIRIVIQGPANRWTGRRTERQFDGLPSIERLAVTYRCNAFPIRRR